MKERQEEWIRLRLIIVFLSFVMLLSIAGVRAYQLQILKQTEYFRRAACQNTLTVDLQPSRGVISDRHGHELAVSIEVDSAYAHPWQLENLQDAAKRLSGALQCRYDAIMKKLTASSRFVWIQRGITPAERKRIEDNHLTGVGFIPESKRCYPHREIAGQLLGFVNIDGKGLEGLEAIYDRQLKGGVRQIIANRDAYGRMLLTSSSIPLGIPQGNNLTLTLDLTIQYVLEKELKKAVEAAKAKGGIGIVMDPKTGEVLALALQPSFNPNNFRTSSPHQWRNRAVTDCFDPGSTFKVFFAAAALEQGVIAPDDMIDCENGVYRVGRRTIHDVHKYDLLSFREIIKYSSNIGVTKVSERMSAEDLYTYIRAFGFGEQTGVDLPTESSGLVRHYKAWREIDQRNICFGQSISVTALQLINGLCAIANGGYLMRPYIVKAVLDEHGDCIKEFHPAVVRKAMSEETARILTDIMIEVVAEGGTGTRAAIPGLEVAGKTGTAQKVDPETGTYSMRKVVGSFIGFVPARSPRLAVLIAIDEPCGRGFGGTVAAPAFKAVVEQVLPYLNIIPQEQGTTLLTSADAGAADVLPSGEVFETQVNGGAVPEQADSVPDFSGLSMRRVLTMARERSLSLQIEGTGKAVLQEPKPGTPLTGVSVCRVVFHPVQ